MSCTTAPCRRPQRSRRCPTSARAMSNREDYDEIARFALRDRSPVCSHDETVLLVRARSYDQLQPMQLLDYFRARISREDGSASSRSEHPRCPTSRSRRIERSATAELPHATPVSARQLEIGRQAEAFRAPDLTAPEHPPAAPSPPCRSSRRRSNGSEATRPPGMGSPARSQLLSAGAAAHGVARFLSAVASVRTDPTLGRPLGLRTADRPASGDRPAFDRPATILLAINRQGYRLLAGDDDWIVERPRHLGRRPLTSAGERRWDERGAKLLRRERFETRRGG